MASTQVTDKAEARRDTLFGLFDGVVSVVGMIFGLLIAHTPAHFIALAGLGAAVSATVSMTTGLYESSSSDLPRTVRLRGAVGMAIGTAVGSMMPVWPFFVADGSTAILLAGVGCVAVATWIGYAKARGWRGYVRAYLVLCSAASVTLAVVAAFPGSGA